MERIAIVLGMVGLLVLGYSAVRRWQVRRVRRLAATDPLLAGLLPGVPAIVYFTSPHCLPCQTQQQPALRALQSDLGGGLQIVEVNALADPEAAARWGVLSVPTTYILDRQGRPREVNYGVAGLEKLRRQLESILDGAG